MSEEMMECPHCGTKHKKRTEEEKKAHLSHPSQDVKCSQVLQLSYSSESYSPSKGKYTLMV